MALSSSSAMTVKSQMFELLRNAKFASADIYQILDISLAVNITLSLF